MSFIKTIRLGYYLNTHKLNHNTFCKSQTFSYIFRNCSVATNDALSPSEKMQEILQKKFPRAKKIEVNDMSGGCGSMYEIFVETIEFKGLPLVKQHMLINETLKEQIKSMHGLTVKTKIPDGS